MEPIYLVHPMHGTHIAYNTDEVERCKLNGWMLRDEAGEGVVESVVEAPKKRGRPKGSKNKPKAD